VFEVWSQRGGLKGVFQKPLFNSYPNVLSVTEKEVRDSARRLRN